MGENKLYDLIVLGGGPAGYLGAERAAEKGYKTLLIEKKFLGGVCLNEGCIPSKTFLNSAKIYDKARYSEDYGITAENVSYDHSRALKRKNKVVKTLVAGIRNQLKKNQVKIVEGKGIVQKRGDTGYQIKVNDKTYTGKRLLLATGSKPMTPPIPGLKENLNNGFLITNREILDVEEIPQSLIIIGGGIVGLEMGSYFNSVGSEVTVVEMLDHIGGNIDKDISQRLLKVYQKKGIDFKLNSKVTEIKEGKIIYENENKEIEITGDRALLAIGRTPVVNNIGLENIGVEVESGRIKVDEKGQTNLPGVYAAGDVNGKSMLAHTAYREAEVCINNMTNKKDIMRYHAVPGVIYTNPEVAWVGETVESAQKKNINYEVSTIPMRYSGRYVAETKRGNGICKVLIDKKYRKLIGVHMMGNYASEIIYGAAMMIENELRVEDIKELIFPHPTVSEIIRENIFQF
ncbi:MAG: dihydrolipoyl dehydrogenase [Bacillota bacterium]